MSPRKPRIVAALVAVVVAWSGVSFYRLNHHDQHTDRRLERLERALDELHEAFPRGIRISPPLDEPATITIPTP